MEQEDTVREAFMLQLSKMVGEVVFGMVPRINTTVLQELKLHSVESGGVWVENQHLTDIMLRAVGYSGSSRTPVFFLPYSEIAFLVTSVEGQSLSETSLGL